MPRTILITGATDGLGLAVAHQLAGAGNRVIVHGRRADRLQEVADEILAQTGRRPDTATADLSSLEQVRGLAVQVGELTDSLQVLINNAGIGTGEPDGRHRSTSADGYELRLAVNYLAPFDLTLRLLPLLQAGGASRIVNVASDGQEPIRFDDIMLTEDYSGYQAYCQSKLALVAFGFSLSRVLDRVTVNSLHPGSYMPTKMVLADGADVVDSLVGGVDAVSELATADLFADVTGRYFERVRESRAHEAAYDLGVQDRLWEVSLELTGAPDPRPASMAS
jgi:NAD(P)-dependent dehydrogenase (short-subunit alcohol dehydrogenase family)